MNTNQQWSGYGQPETTEIFRELVEATPQLPIDKLVKFTKSGLAKLKGIEENTVSNPLTEQSPKTVRL